MLKYLLITLLAIFGIVGYFLYKTENLNFISIERPYNNYRVGVTTDKSTYKDGDDIQIILSENNPVQFQVILKSGTDKGTITYAKYVKTYLYTVNSKNFSPEATVEVWENTEKYLPELVGKTEIKIQKN